MSENILPFIGKKVNEQKLGKNGYCYLLQFLKEIYGKI